MKQGSQSQKQKIWPTFFNILLLCLACLAFYNYWEGMIAPILFINKSLLIIDLLMGLCLCGIFLLLGFQCLGGQSSQTSGQISPDEIILSERKILEIFMAAINFMLSMMILSLLILTCLVDLNLLRYL
jgi:hypothetical protein